MAALRLLNEFGFSGVVLALEPARRCVGKCTFCFAQLNARKQYAGKQFRDEDPGTFESTVEKAFGPEYDPTNFLQWSLKNRMPVGYSNTVEPWQDIDQARSILGILDHHNIPVFFQSRGTNFDAVWPQLRPLHDNAVLFVSFPSPDDRVIRRFEPGTPKSDERWAMIEKAADAGFHTILALAPYHEEWCKEPANFVLEAADRGVKGVFFDRLHLNRRQVEACNDPVTVRMAGEPLGDVFADHAHAVHGACADAGLRFHTYNRAFTQLGLLNNQADLSPTGVFRRGREWPYVDQAFLLDLDHLTFDRDPEDDGPVLVRWADALAAMEASTPEGRVDQPFSYSSMRDLMCVKNLAPAWRRTLSSSAPARSYYRALWNSPTNRGFAWRHVHARIAMRPDGTPWLDGESNLVMAFDPDFDGPGQGRVFDTLGGLPEYEFPADTPNIGG